MYEAYHDYSMNNEYVPAARTKDATWLAERETRDMLYKHMFKAVIAFTVICQLIIN